MRVASSLSTPLMTPDTFKFRVTKIDVINHARLFVSHIACLAIFLRALQCVKAMHALSIDTKGHVKIGDF